MRQSALGHTDLGQDRLETRQHDDQGPDLDKSDQMTTNDPQATPARLGAVGAGFRGAYPASFFGGSPWHAHSQRGSCSSGPGVGRCPVQGLPLPPGPSWAPDSHSAVRRRDIRRAGSVIRRGGMGAPRGRLPGTEAAPGHASHHMATSCYATTPAPHPAHSVVTDSFCARTNGRYKAMATVTPAGPCSNGGEVRPQWRRVPFRMEPFEWSRCNMSHMHHIRAHPT